MKDNSDLNRREFVRKSCALLGIGAAISTLENCSSPNVVPTPTANFTVDLTAPGNSALLNNGGAIVKNGIIIIRKSSSTYIALSTICTHAGCTVNYSANSARLTCPCHGSVFSNSGQVLQGPATSPLPTYSVTISGSILTVK